MSIDLSLTLSQRDICYVTKTLSEWHELCRIIVGTIFNVSETFITNDKIDTFWIWNIKMCMKPIQNGDFVTLWKWDNMQNVSQTLRVGW